MTTMMPRWPRSTASWTALLLISLATSCTALVIFVASSHARRSSDPDHVAVAFAGNSMLYFNDCPRLLHQMCQATRNSVHTDSCLRGGATLTTLWNKGNGMGRKFATEQAISHTIPTTAYDIGPPNVQQLLSRRWNFVILNDYTQHPARPETIQESVQTLTKHYLPLLGTAVPILIQTPAYRKPKINNSEDLGDFHEFTERLQAGLQEYAAAVPNARMAPVGRAYQLVRDTNIALWQKLYSWDDFHPSPFGTWLQTCVLYCTMFHECPPVYNALWWDKCRYMQPPDQKPLPLPTNAQAQELRRIACLTCGINWIH